MQKGLSQESQPKENWKFFKIKKLKIIKIEKSIIKNIGSDTYEKDSLIGIAGKMKKTDTQTLKENIEINYKKCWWIYWKR